MHSMYQAARSFVYRHARPLELALWRFHFEDAAREDVLLALSAYQNADGGFGHALEPDAWNPHSTPIQTWAATEVLREIGWQHGGHPMVQGILSWLQSGAHFHAGRWANTVPTNNDFPHAPWWTWSPHTDEPESYNPTACLAGFALRFAPGGSPVHTLACQTAFDALAALYSQPEAEMHTLSCYIRLHEYLGTAGLEKCFDLQRLGECLSAQVKQTLDKDADTWESGYGCKPSSFFSDRQSPFYSDNRALAARECAHIRDTQGPEGAWEVNWGWADYPGEWAVSRVWWQAHNIIGNVRFVRNVCEQAQQGDREGEKTS